MCDNCTELRRRATIFEWALRKIELPYACIMTHHEIRFYKAIAKEALDSQGIKRSNNSLPRWIGLNNLLYFWSKRRYG